jgi:hypothetical protein
MLVAENPSEWSHDRGRRQLGFITRTGFAIYALNTPTAGTSSTTAPDP